MPWSIAGSGPPGGWSSPPPPPPPHQLSSAVASSGGGDQFISSSNLASSGGGIGIPSSSYASDQVSELPQSGGAPQSGGWSLPQSGAPSLSSLCMSDRVGSSSYAAPLSSHEPSPHSFQLKSSPPPSSPAGGALPSFAGTSSAGPPSTPSASTGACFRDRLLILTIPSSTRSLPSASPTESPLSLFVVVLSFFGSCPSFAFSPPLAFKASRAFLIACSTFRLKKKPLLSVTSFPSAGLVPVAPSSSSSSSSTFCLNASDLFKAPCFTAPVPF
mmetsp:Transcript_37661/g.61047  ORF Transcript_37661/g.61047 Transcript_37661/m.61047 type:complete len:272 (+) Transcript_37661:1722-2537(+)